MKKLEAYPNWAIVNTIASLLEGALIAHFAAFWGRQEWYDLQWDRIFGAKASDLLAGCNRTPGTESDFILKRWRYELREAKGSNGVRTLDDLISGSREVPAPDREPDLFGEERLQVILLRHRFHKMVSQDEESGDMPLLIYKGSQGQMAFEFRVPTGHISNNTMILSCEMRSALGFQDIEGEYCMRMRIKAEPGYLAFEVISADQADEIRGCAVYLQGRATVDGEIRALSDWVKFSARHVTRGWLETHRLAAKALRSHELKNVSAEAPSSSVASSSRSMTSPTTTSAIHPHSFTDKHYVTCLENALAEGYQARLTWPAGSSARQSPTFAAPSSKRDCSQKNKRLTVPLSLLPKALAKNQGDVDSWRIWLRIVPESSTPFRCAVAKKGTTPQQTDFATFNITGKRAHELLEHASRLRGCATPKDVSNNRSAHVRGQRRLPSLLDGSFVGSYNLAVKKRAIPASRHSEKQVRPFNWHSDRAVVCFRFRAVGSQKWYTSRDEAAARSLLQDVEAGEQGTSKERPEVPTTTFQPELAARNDALNCNGKAIRVSEANADDDDEALSVDDLDASNNAEANAINDEQLSDNGPILISVRRLKRHAPVFDEESENKPILACMRCSA